jgi:hypothetical protein
MEVEIDYNIVSEIAGHKSNTKVKMKDAAKDIYKHVKEKAMQLAVNGTFKTFSTIDELENVLSTAIGSNYNISVYDEDFGG